VAFYYGDWLVDDLRGGPAKSAKCNVTMWEVPMTLDRALLFLCLFFINPVVSPSGGNIAMGDFCRMMATLSALGNKQRSAIYSAPPSARPSKAIHPWLFHALKNSIIVSDN